MFGELLFFFVFQKVGISYKASKKTAAGKAFPFPTAARLLYLL